MISASGIGSGLDVEGIVDTLVQAKSFTLQRLQTKHTDYNTQLSAYGQIKNSIANFRDAMTNLSSMDKFAVFQTQSSNDKILTATTDAKASQGSYAIVVNALATSHRIAADGVADKTAAVGAAGDMKIQVGSESFTISVASTDSLEKIRETINDASDNDMVKATILNLDDGMGGTESRLVLNGEQTGASNTITVSDVSGNTASTLNFATQLQAAADAQLTIDGFTATRSTNLISDVIDGVTLDIEKADAETVILEISRDTASIKESAQQFVNDFNKLIEEIDKNLENDLHNDSSLRHIKTELKRELTVAAQGVGSYTILAEIGIKSDGTTGKLSLDSTTFDSAIKTNFHDVAKLFSDSTEGFATRYVDLAKQYLGTDGVVTMRTSSLDDNIFKLNDRIDRENAHLVKLRADYKKQYSALDKIMSEMNGMQQYLNAQLSQMPSINKSGSKK